MASEARPYYSERGLSAAYYDLITASDATLEGDIDLYAGLAPCGGEILELGAGTGRVAVALAERGFAVVGVDLAPAMLAQAEARRAQLPAEAAIRLSFKRGDMTALRLDRQFDAVICPFFGLAHLPAGSAWTNTFQVMARHLRPGGACAVHLPNPEMLARETPYDPDLPVMRLPLDGPGRRLELFVKDRSFKPRIGRFDQLIEYVVAAPSGVERRSVERQTYYSADPLPFAAAAGLTPEGPPQELNGVGRMFVFRGPA